MLIEADRVVVKCVYTHVERRTTMTAHRQRGRWTGAVAVALLAWLAAAVAAGLAGALARTAGPPVVLLAFVVVPIAIALGVYAGSAGFRAWAAGLSLTWIVGLHLWRLVGLGFVAAWLSGDLPGGFAIPEGLGDAAAAAGAAALLPSLRRGAAPRRWLLAWNSFGLVDLLSALVVGILYSNGSLGVLSRGGMTTELMVTFPVSVIPTFLVPLFILLHLLTYSRVEGRRARRASPGPSGTVHGDVGRPVHGVAGSSPASPARAGVPGVLRG
jgi:hypothetical protein